jgi:hypothetical protein
MRGSWTIGGDLHVKEVRVLSGVVVLKVHECGAQGA